MTFDFGIKSASRFEGLGFYGALWLVEFRDMTRAIVVEDSFGDYGELPGPNYVLEREERP